MSLAHIWFSTLPTPEQKKEWPDWNLEHPAGYVVEVGNSQYHLGVKTLEEAKNFARKYGATDFYGDGGCPKSWEGREDGDEKLEWVTEEQAAKGLKDLFDREE